LAARKKAKVALAAHCVQHKWCLLAQSCDMDAEVKKIVQTKMSKILKTVVQDQEREREEEREKEETDTLLDTSLVEGDEEGTEDNDSRNSDDEDDDSRNSDDEDDGEEEDIYK
jgi:3-methyladenine DNA glycosylase AlkD